MSTFEILFYINCLIGFLTFLFILPTLDEVYAVDVFVSFILITLSGILSLCVVLLSFKEIMNKYKKVYEEQVFPIVKTASLFLPVVCLLLLWFI